MINLSHDKVEDLSVIKLFDFNGIPPQYGVIIVFKP